MNKTAIKNFAIWARRKLISDITYKAGMLGVTENGVAQPLPQSTRDLQFFDIGTKDYAEVSGTAIEQRNALVKVIRAKMQGSDYKTAFRSVVEEVAYTWFNRLIAVRFMEVNDYLPSHIRVLSSESEGKLEPDFVTAPFETDLEFSESERDRIYQLKDENKLDELFRMLFIRQCNQLSEILPGLFEQIQDYTELLLNISFTDKDGIVYHLTHDISEDEFNVEKEGQVEIIGWMYQYYNTEPKDEVFALLKKNVKITKERIPAATQLFTPDWIVRYMVENSLGRLWVEGHPNESLKGNWKYYLEEAEQEPDVVQQLNQVREEYAKLSPTDIKVIDPCMGSGHILVYAFDVLMQIYTSQGYVEREAAKSILIHNLYGIDIDVRAYQLAYFAVMMKARQYNRRIFSEHITPNLIAIRNPENISKSVLKRLGKLEPVGLRLVEDFEDAEEYGSILQVSYTEDELERLEKKLAEVEEEVQYGNLLVQIEAAECVRLVKPLIQQARLLSQKYDVVVTNPPYMGASGMGEKLSSFVKDSYPESKNDLFAVSIKRSFAMLKPYGYSAMITMESWMFLSSFEKLRIHICKEKTIISMIHMPYLGKGGTSLGINFGTEMAVIQNKAICGYTGTYDRIAYYETDDEGVPIEFPTKNEYYKHAQQNNFSRIPGAPVAYWCGHEFFMAFEGTKISDIADVQEGLKTGDNERFIRLWYEVDFTKTSMFWLSDAKWFFHTKGGDYRKWYGNQLSVLNYSREGHELKSFSGSSLTGIDNYLKENISYSRITSAKTSFRYTDRGSIPNMAGLALYPHENLYYILAWLNTSIVCEMLNITNPTINFPPGTIGKLPIRIEGIDKDVVTRLSKANVDLSRNDWDSFEVSWDFQRHPLLPRLPLGSETVFIGKKGQFGSYTFTSAQLANEFSFWQKETEERFQQLKTNEEEINRFFIDVYGLQHELTPEVEDKDVTVRRADMGRDIRSLISYAVGCMFGRYSLDIPGLAYAGGQWDASKYSSFVPDADNCIPITDDEYFTDDIVGRFVEFMRTVYGVETLEENLDFVASALGNNGNTSREVIRNYFLNDFYKDHLKIYQKRPIYWLFDSGKQNGFKALVYMHRWNADTVGNLRVEYLHKMQTVYEHETENCQEMIDHGSGREVAAATKRKEKLIKQLKECRDYDALVAHIAFSKIDIDLDDGVKVNYRKAQTGSDGKFCEILANSKDIMAKE